MESIEQTELTNKVETDSWVESQLTALRSVEGWRDWERKGKKKRTHGHRQQYGDYGGRGGGR